MEKKEAVQVIYCPVCTFPIEFCEYSENFQECKKWLAVSHPEAYPDLSEEFEKIRNGESIPAPEETKKAAGKAKKVKIEEKKRVTFSILKRGATKHITLIEGLKNFGINLKEISKKLRKEFSSGCSIVDENIEIQGDHIDGIIDKLIEDYPEIKEDDIFISDKNLTKKSKKGQKK